ncbi:MAG: iron-containing redox enzyme family protein [Solirubrobacterales bacterium]|nr:iron-containing redox enzyme family protein [Solirubrobacterales bacterium]
MATAPVTHPMFDRRIEDALADPDLTERLAQHPDAAAALVADARALAAAAFDDDDETALDAAHRSLYLLYAQGGWSPVHAPRANEHDLTVAAVLLELEAGFERQLGRLPLPDDLPPDPDAFAPWLADLALERELPQLPPTGMGPYIRDTITLDQLKEIVAQRSLFFLKEPDPWAMVIPSLQGPAKAGLLDLLLDEYGWGRHDHMHSTVYEHLMRRLDLDTAYDAYLPRASWQFLATMNLQGLYARHRRLCRRMYGYIYLVEADSPRSMRNYIAGYHRLGITDEDILKFYDLHITADEGHQDVALNEVVMPVVRAEPAAMEEVARGVLEGHLVHHDFSRHLHACFTAGRSSMRESA